MEDVYIVAETLSAPILAGGVAGASVSIATASGTTIPLTGRVVKVSATAATTSGSCTMAKGIVDGQQVTLINESANNIVFSGNMQGAAAATCSANQGCILTWSAADTAWFVTKG